MKNSIFKIILFIILILPIFVFAKEKVYIENVTIEENNNVEIVSPASFNDLNFNTDLKFSKVGSYVIYKLTITNSDDENYSIDNSSFKEESENINYTYKCDSKDNLIIKNSSTICHIKISYDKGVDIIEVFDKTTHTEEKTLTLNFTNELANPKTSYNFTRIILFLISIVLAFIVFFEIKNKKYILNIIIILLIFTPTTLKAIEKITINLNSKIEIVDNGRICSHKAVNLKEHIMCLIETDIKDGCDKLYEMKINRYKTIINDYETGKRSVEYFNYDKYNKDIITKLLKMIEKFSRDDLKIEDITNEELREYESFMQQFNDDPDEFEYIYSFSNKPLVDIYSKMLNWDNTFRNKPNENTYKEYPEGIYVDNYRFIPIIRQLTDDSLRGYGYIKYSKDDDIRDVTDFNDLIKYKIVSPNEIEIVLNGKFEASKTLPIYGEIENTEVNGELTLYLNRDSNGNVSITDYEINPESSSLSSLHRRMGLINDVNDVFINMQRMKVHNSNININGIEEKQETANLFEQLLSRYYQSMYKLTGIRKLNVEAHQTEKFGYKEKEFYKFMGMDLSFENLWDKYDLVCDSDETCIPKYNRFYEEYYNSIGIKPFICDNPRHCNVGYLTYYSKNIDFSRYTVIYNNKFYENEDGLFRFIADYFGIDISNSTNIKNSVINGIYSFGS